MTNPRFSVQKFSWIEVAKEVSKLAGKTYRPCYVREVATGYRPNSNLEAILRRLGVMQGEAA